jgi:IstB-like ATP binding protein
MVLAPEKGRKGPRRPRARLPAHSALRWTRSGARGRFYNVVDLVIRLETEARNARQGRLADHLTRMDFVILDELGYLPFAQSGGPALVPPRQQTLRAHHKPRLR